MKENGQTIYTMEEAYYITKYTIIIKLIIKIFHIIITLGSNMKVYLKMEKDMEQVCLSFTIARRSSGLL